jgi:hypothetical protein
MDSEENSHWSALRQHWNESAKRERENPPADKPTHEHMVANGLPICDAPKDGTVVWVIENGSVGVFLAHQNEISWWVEDAGDLWPSKPTRWLPRTFPAPLTKE